MQPTVIGCRIGAATTGEPMRRHLLILLSCFALASTLPAQPAPSAKDTIAYTTALVRLRDKPLANARSLAAVGQGTRVRLHKCSAGWCRVGVSQLVGYVPQSSLTARAPGGFLSKRGFVDSRGSSVRSPSRVLRSNLHKALRRDVGMGPTASVSLGAVPVRIMEGSRTGSELAVRL